MIVKKENEKRLVKDIKHLISLSQNKAVRAIDNERVLLYWNIGKRIIEELQNGQDRAGYGKEIIKNLSNNLQPDFGSGYSIRQLELMRQFYKIFSNTNTLHSQLNWSQYKLLIRLDTQDKREFYIGETTKMDGQEESLRDKSTHHYLKDYFLVMINSLF